MSTVELKESKNRNKNECFCKRYLVTEPVTVDETSAEKLDQIEIINFGEVLPGTEAVKFFDLKNRSNHPILCSIQRISHVNEIYQTFHFKKYKVKLDPRSTRKLKITYIPLLDNEKSSDLFRITGGDADVIQDIRLVGKCLGTRVKCSTKRLHFSVTPTKRKKNCIFELSNISEVPAIFEFDLDENEDRFVVDTAKGQIPPKRSVYITVTFNGKTEGIHYKRLVVLIYKHEPIMIDLLAECYKNQSLLNNSVAYATEDQSSYCAFFNDCYFADDKLLPIKLNNIYFDFGRVLPETLLNSDQNKNVAVGILKNNMQNDILVSWYRDSQNIFFIQPRELQVKPDECGYFELSFKPNFRDHFYYKRMTGRIHWKNAPRPNTPVGLVECKASEDVEYIPLEVNLTMIGHSFPENQSWITAVEVVPSRIIFPICLPGSQMYTTFMLKCDSPLPVLFKFVAPKRSLITVKPAMGLMRFTKLFVARLNSQSISTIYKEEWKVEINGESHRYLRIVFLGQSEIPSVAVGTDNLVRFNTTLPGCQNFVKVPVKNTSPYHLRLDLEMNNNEYFYVKPSFVELYPNEEVCTEWSFYAKLDVPQQTEIQCFTRAISNADELIGLPYETRVRIEASCEYSQLCATPRYMEFGDVPWGVTKDVEFKIFNFGKSAVCYTLKARTVKGNKDNVKISTASAKLLPLESKTVYISFRTETKGDHVLQIDYYTRINEFLETQTTDMPIELFSIQYNCICPTIQIEECVEHDLSRMFSKWDMWNFFSVDNINEELRNVEEGETKTIKIQLPTIPCQEKEYYIRFVLRNTSEFDITASLSRIKMCTCEVVEISKSISFRQKVLNCPHRQMLKMRLSEEVIYGNSFQYLDIMMNFNLITNEELAYDMKLSEDRHIVFCIRMDIIPTDVAKISLYDSANHETFINMFIGAKEPPCQSVWLYNSTSQEAPFQLMVEELDAMNETEGFPVLLCFNSIGTIAPFSSKALLFRFHPIEAKKYQITLPLVLGGETISLKFSAMGVYKYDQDLIHKISMRIPNKCLQLGDFPISLSVDSITVEPFPVWNTKEKLIYMKNVTKNRIIEYTWIRSTMERVIEVTADKENGILGPDEMVAVVLKFQSFGIPAISAMNISCKFIDITQNEIHKESIRKYEERQKQIDEYFMIDENGVHTLENELKIQPPSEEKYITLASTFHTISSLELSHYLDIEEYFNHNPLENFKPAKNIQLNDIDKTKSEECDPFISHTLECFLMDILRSPVFQELVQCQQKASPPYYINFKQNEEKDKLKSKQSREREMYRYLAQSPRRDLSNTFKSMIKESVQQTFF